MIGHYLVVDSSLPTDPLDPLDCLEDDAAANGFSPTLPNLEALYFLLFPPSALMNESRLSARGFADDADDDDDAAANDRLDEALSCRAAC
jgi:hypothetical protein